MLKGAISIDIDTLNTHFKGQGLKKENYDFSDFRQGIDNFLKLLAEFKIKATFFIVGRDLLFPQNVEIVQKIIKDGHEVANHSMNHIQGFRLLGEKEKGEEIREGEMIILEKTKKKPVGFRAPGWNIDDKVFELLKLRNYLYDSSVFPSYFNPALKFLHFTSMANRSGADRTTLGEMKYSFSPAAPYLFPGENGKKLVEFPISVTPVIRLPFFATFSLKTGLKLFNVSYNLMKFWRRPIIFEFHLFDFIDFEKPEFKDQIPSKSERGVYVPQSIHTPFNKKWDLFHKIISIMAKDYKFETMENLAKDYLKRYDPAA
ncbi:MAG: polysaccharide deacetylase family protein [Candidatus Pacebacteria bacterium]|nr:polysaccharide deacetylase family protein [Candidatus Paceibacterota bacterium]